MAKVSLTYGQMPSWEVFEKAFREEVPSGWYRFGNDERQGNSSLTVGQLWTELADAIFDWEDGNDHAGDWASCVLSTLGIEWI